MQPIPHRLRLIGALLRRGPSIARMSLAQIAQSQTVNPRQLRLARWMVGGIRKGVSVTDRTIATADGPLQLRVYTPTRSTIGLRPLVVYFHGGGWVLGSVHISDWISSTVALDVDAVVVSVGYRLAPAHQFPAGVEDCYAGLRWCAEHAAELGADAGRIGVMGESAGGNLAAVVCLLARDRGGPQLRHQALVYPVTDGAMATASYQANRDAIILSAAEMRAFYGHYLARGADPLDWRVSPLRAPDHSSLPPAIVVVAGHDPLRDEGVAYAETLRSAGVPVVLQEYPAMPHGFVNFPYLARDARPAMAAITAEQRAALQPASAP